MHTMLHVATCSCWQGPCATLYGDSCQCNTGCSEGCSCEHACKIECVPLRAWKGSQQPAEQHTCILSNMPANLLWHAALKTCLLAAPSPVLAAVPR